MAIADRVTLYKELEALRGRPLLVYCTSNRQGAAAKMSKDVIPDFLIQLVKLPKRAKGLDLLLVSEGGEPTVAWQIVSLIRERFDKLSVLVPQSAYSAATLIALGADEIVMHPHGNLGPIDPQMSAPVPGASGEGGDRIQFGSEDMTAFFNYARDELGIADQTHLSQVFQAFSKDVGSVAIGAAVRSSQLSLSMGEKLLKLHLDGETADSDAKRISERLNRDFFHHGYPVSRSEASQIGLKVAESDPKLESIMWKIWSSVTEEMNLRSHFNAIAVLADNPDCAALFYPTPLVHVPQGLPPEVQKAAYQQVLSQIAVSHVPPAPYKILHAILESTRYASHYLASGEIYGARQPDLSLRASQVQLKAGWESIPVPKIPNTPRSKTKAKKPK